MAVHQCAGASVVVGWQLGDLRLDLVEKRGVADVRRSCAGVDPGLWAGPQAMNIRARQPQRLADSFHWPSRTSKGKRAIQFFRGVSHGFFEDFRSPVSSSQHALQLGN